MMYSKISDNAYMIIFLALLWAVVSLVSKSGGSEAEVLAFDDQDELLEEAEKNGCDIMKPVTKADVERELSDLRFPIVPKSNALLRVQCFGKLRRVHAGRQSCPF